MSETVDYGIIGGGIVGLATAWQLLQQDTAADVVVLEKEPAVACHQTGHNSGVIHAGIYYEPGSLKAQLCAEGSRRTKRFAVEHGIEFRECGKLLVATDHDELDRMPGLVDRAEHNGISYRRLGAGELGDWEPAIRGLGALFLPATAIIDFGQVARALAADIVARGGRVLTSTRVEQITEHGDGVEVAAGGRTWRCEKLIACAGLQSDRIAALAGLEVDFAILPFRGEYYRIAPEKATLVSRLIYPIPDPDLPFLGVHISPTIGGDLTVGPNAVLGMAREGYEPLSIDRRDLWELLRFSGLPRVAASNVRTGLRELRNSLWRRGYLRECRKYCPGLELDDLHERSAGIRAQAVMADGSFVHDFLIRQTPRMVHVVNAPSPAATSALPIGEMIAARAVSRD